jgi:hypothetical protein
MKQRPTVWTIGLHRDHPVEEARAALFAGVFLAVASCTPRPAPAARPDGSAKLDSSIVDGATSEGVDARGADVRTADGPMVDVNPADVGALDAQTTDVKTSDAQTAEVQPSRDACVPFAPSGAGPPNNDGANLVAPPGGGLVGNSNYFIVGFPPGSTKRSPMTGLDVSIAIAKDIPVPQHFDFQLNAWSPQGSNMAWQQYIFDYYNPPGLSGFIDNWPSKAYAAQLGLVSGGDLINFRVSPNPLMKLSNAILPAGYTLTIHLQNDDKGNITGVTFSATDPHCKAASTGLISLTGLPVDLSGAPLPPMTIKLDAPSPIYALQLNIASQDDVNAGWGTITYSADDLLYVWNDWPPGLEWENIVTAESSNVHYGEVPSTPSRSITQTFMSP